MKQLTLTIPSPSVVLEKFMASHGLTWPNKTLSETLGVLRDHHSESPHTVLGYIL